MNKCYGKIKLFIDSINNKNQFFQNIFILSLIQHNNRFIEGIIKNNFKKYSQKIFSDIHIDKIFEKTKKQLLKEKIINENLTLELCAKGESFDSLSDYELYDLIEFCEEKIETQIEKKALLEAAV